MDIETAASIVYDSIITYELFDGICLVREKSKSLYGLYEWMIVAQSDKLVYDDEDIKERIIDVIGLKGVLLDLGVWRPIGSDGEQQECRLIEKQQLKRV